MPSQKRRIAKVSALIMRGPKQHEVGMLTVLCFETRVPSMGACRSLHSLVMATALSAFQFRDLGGFKFVKGG